MDPRPRVDYRTPAQKDRQFRKENRRRGLIEKRELNREINAIEKAEADDRRKSAAAA